MTQSICRVSGAHRLCCIARCLFGWILNTADIAPLASKPRSMLVLNGNSDTRPCSDTTDYLSPGIHAQNNFTACMPQLVTGESIFTMYCYTLNWMLWTAEFIHVSHITNSRRHISSIPQHTGTAKPSPNNINAVVIMVIQLITNIKHIHGRDKREPARAQTRQPGLEKSRFLGFKGFFSTKTDVAKHESVTQKHLKSASQRNHTVVYTVCSFPFHREKWRKWSINLTNHNSNLNIRFKLLI